MRPLIALISIPLFLFSFTIIHQQILGFKIGSDFTITIKGTSNLHDWESNVEKLTGTASFSFGEDGSVFINECNASIPVKSIKSSKGSIMDKKTWKALNANDYPNIEYRLTNFDNVIKTVNGFTANTKGMLRIAGTTKSVSIDITGKELTNGGYEITGSKNLKMTSFNVDPPTAMFGAVTTGDDITIKFRVVLNQK